VMDDSPNTPLALALIGGAALCVFMASRGWPQVDGKTVKPGAYAQSIVKGDPLSPGPVTNETSDIQTGLSALLTIWVLSKLAGLFSGFPNFFGDNGANAGDEGGDNSGDEGGDDGAPDIPPIEEIPL
jgi:hypothetical protein